MKFTIEIEKDASPHQVLELLARTLPDVIAAGSSGPVFDSNGEQVGTWRVQRWSGAMRKLLEGNHR